MSRAPSPKVREVGKAEGIVLARDPWHQESRRHLRRRRPARSENMLYLMLALVALLVAPAFAQTTPTTQPAGDLALKLITEEGKKQLQATLTANGKPVENATIEFYVARTFGRLSIGKDQTLDDGTAQVAFPADLPGNADGELHVTAVVQGPTKYTGVAAHGMFAGAAVVPVSSEPFPRALWAPSAPVLLIVTIVGILAAVWCIYAYVVAQLWAISKGR